MNLINQKIRLVTCTVCKIDKETDELQPICSCGRVMTTVTKSLIAGERNDK